MSRDKVLLLLNFIASAVVGAGIIALVQHFSGDGSVDWTYALVLGIALGLGNCWRLYWRWRRPNP